jgi:hypothetical protein
MSSFSPISSPPNPLPTKWGGERDLPALFLAAKPPKIAPKRIPPSPRGRGGKGGEGKKPYLKSIGVRGREKNDLPNSLFAQECDVVEVITAEGTNYDQSTQRLDIH